MRNIVGCLAAVLLIFALVIPASAVPISNTFWVGMEDLRLPGGDKDYNDLVVSMSGTGLSIRGSGAWMPMVTPDQNGTPYWDNPSWDGGTGGWNIGYFVLGTGNFAGNPNSPHLSVSQVQYWGVGTNYDPSVQYFSTGGVETTILAEVAGYSGSNALYWFPVSNPSARTLIFSGSNGVGTSVPFNPGGSDFGIYLESPGGNFLSTVDGKQFSTFSQVPEPVSTALVGGGLLALGLLRRRARRTAV